LLHVNAHLWFEESGISIELSPKFGNVTKEADNETHTGATTFWYYKSISSYVIKIKITEENGKMIMNSTMYPCNKKLTKKFESLISMVFEKDNEMTNLSCPMPEVNLCR
jgi:hypothetical protein